MSENLRRLSKPLSQRAVPKNTQSHRTEVGERRKTDLDIRYRTKWTAENLGHGTFPLTRKKDCKTSLGSSFGRPVSRISWITARNSKELSSRYTSNNVDVTGKKAAHSLSQQHSVRSSRLPNRFSIRLRRSQMRIEPGTPSSTLISDNSRTLQESNKNLQLLHSNASYLKKNFDQSSRNSDSFSTSSLSFFGLNGPEPIVSSSTPSSLSLSSTSREFSTHVQCENCLHDSCSDSVVGSERFASLLCSNEIEKSLLNIQKLGRGGAKEEKMTQTSSSKELEYVPTPTLLYSTRRNEKTNSVRLCSLLPDSGTIDTETSRSKPFISERQTLPFLRSGPILHCFIGASNRPSGRFISYVFRPIILFIFPLIYFIVCYFLIILGLLEWFSYPLDQILA